MAAVRAGALGLARGNRYLVFSTNNRNTWSDDGRDSGGEGSDVKVCVRKGKGYGVHTVSPETAQSRYTQRKRMVDLKLILCDWTLVLAMFGLFLAIIDTEIVAMQRIDYTNFRSQLSIVLRSSIILSTIILLFVLLCYHIADTKIHLIETGADQWRVGVDRKRLIHISIELIVCAICPLPESGEVTWPMLGKTPEITERRFKLPISVLLALPMFGRLYLLARYVVMHSAIYQDCATRTIASLNQVSVDFRFVLKSALYSRPLTVLSATTVIFWMCIAWCLTQCERYAFDSIPGYQHFLDFLWFAIITFFSIGYGDIQVHTYCGRALAMLTAIVGTLFASTLIALVSRRISLSTSEKRVNHLIAESHITKKNKDAAARVLQSTWRVVLQARKATEDNHSMGHLRQAQRHLLKCILRFRKTRLRLRASAEDDDDFFTARKAFLETEERLAKVRRRQAQLNDEMNTLFGHVQSLTSIIQ